MQINLKGVWFGCKYAIQAMRNNPTDEAKGLRVGGSIINTASFVAIMGAATPQLACTFDSYIWWAYDLILPTRRHCFKGWLRPCVIVLLRLTMTGCRACHDS